MAEENWKAVPGYESNYEISDLGNLRSKERYSRQKGRWGFAMVRFPAAPMKISTSPSGYKYAGLTLDGDCTKHLIHRLVLRAFIGESDLQCNHKDGDKSNNRLNNLEFCTSIQNLRHCIDVLGKKRGEGAGNALLTEDKVRSIRKDRRLLREIAADYGVTPQAISLVRSRKNWAHVQD